jgi:hypothetical protein
MTRVVAWSFGVLLLVSGCAGGAETRRFQSRVIRGVSPDEVLEAARVVLHREFGALNAEPARRTIVSEPAHYQTKRESGSARDFYRGESAMRQIAHCRVEQRDSVAVLMLRIEIQRQDTERGEVAGQREPSRLSDAPSYTPIERDAATTQSQNTVWTFVRRHTALESELLSEVQDRFAPATQTPAAQTADLSGDPADADLVAD